MCGSAIITDDRTDVRHVPDGAQQMHDYSTFERPLPHPGEHLSADYLPEYGLTAGALAKAMGLKDRSRVERIIRGKNPITSDTALRLGKVFGTSADFWMGLQTQHDLSQAAIASRDELERITPLPMPEVA
jgi:addiction module HigA family antidote